MLPYILIMIISFGGDHTVTIDQQFPTQQACFNIKQDIEQHINLSGEFIDSSNCYETQSGVVTK